MARFEVSGAELVLRLGLGEKIAAFHGDVRVPLSSVREIRAIADPRSEMRGMRAPGTGIPGLLTLGTIRASSGKDFAIRTNNGPAIVVELEGEPFQRLVVSDPDAQHTAERLSAALRQAP